MEIEVFWTDFAKNELRRIFDFHKENVDIKIAKKITSQIILNVDILKRFPIIGVIEELLIDGVKRVVNGF